MTKLTRTPTLSSSEKRLRGQTGQKRLLVFIVSREMSRYFQIGALTTASAPPGIIGKLSCFVQVTLDASYFLFPEASCQHTHCTILLLKSLLSYLAPSITAGVPEACPYRQAAPMSASCQRKLDLITEI